jgi:trigger factor
LKVKTNQLESCEVQLIIELEAEQLNQAKGAAARRLARRVNIPGFRKGKAPYNVILQHVGEDRIVENAVDDLGRRVYKEALAQTELNPFAPGNLVDASLEDTPTFTFNVPLSPSVNLGDYRAVRVKHQPVEVADDAVAEAMGRLQAEHALLEPIKRPAQLGDVLTIDAHGTLNHGDEDAETLADEKDMDLLLEAESEWPMPGLTGKLVGMEIDEIREFELRFPEDYANENLAGQRVHWTINCKGAKSRTLPEMNDEFAVLVSAEHETLLELRVAVREQLEQAATAQKSREYRREVVDAVLQGCEVSFPPIMLRERVNNLVKEQESALRSRGLTLPDYLKVENKSEEEYRAEIEPDAVAQLQRSLMLTEIVEAESLAVDGKQVDEHIEKTAAPFGDSADKIRAMLRKDNGRRSVELDLLTEMALARLEAIGKGEAPELAPKTDPEAAADATDDSGAETAEDTPAAAADSE